MLVTDLDEREAAKALATFDAVSDLAGVDAALLASLLGDIGEATEAGTVDLLAELRKHLPAEPPATGGSDDDPPPPDPTDALVAKWGTVQGHLWVIGGAGGREHRILCGDCRKPEDVARLFDGRRCNIAFTSPPYASQRKYDPASGFRPIHPDKFVEWFEPVQANVRSVLAPDGSWFVNIKEHCDDGERHLYVKDLTIAHRRQWGWRFVDELSWVHAGFPGKMAGRFKNAWEPVFHFSSGWPIKFQPRQVGHQSDYIPVRRQTDPGREYAHGNIGAPQGEVSGVALPSNVLQISGGSEASHAAAFPVALPTFFIRAYTDAGDIAYDPFMGSGTTLIAAEQTGRVAYGCELSPRYVAVILERASLKGMRPMLVLS